MEEKVNVLELDLESKAQAVLNSYGTDLNTVFELFKRKIVNNEFSATMEEIIKPKEPKVLFEDIMGKYPEIWIAEDFDEPMDWIVDDMLEDPLC